MKHTLLILSLLTVLFSCTRNDDTRTDMRDTETERVNPGPNP